MKMHITTIKSTNGWSIQSAISSGHRVMDGKKKEKKQQNNVMSTNEFMFLIMLQNGKLHISINLIH